MKQIPRDRITSPHITELMEDEIFVFGSNLQGMHLGGAARIACEMPATSFDDQENAIYFEKAQKVNASQPDSIIKVMTWNIRFGIGRGPWFGDACGYKVIYSANEIMNNLKLIAEKINLVKPDILLLQEVDIKSTRSAYINELSWLLDNTYFNYAAYGSQWKAQFIPSDGLGRMDEGNAILSRWPISDAIRIQLALRTDQSTAERYFYERCCMSVVTKVTFPFVYLLSVSTRLLNKILGIKGHERIITQEELKVILHQSSEQGIIDKDETNMFK